MNYCTGEDGNDAAVCSDNQWTVERLCPSDFQCTNSKGQCDPTSEYSVFVVCSKAVASTNGHAMCIKPSSVPPPPSPPPPPIPAPPPPTYASCSSSGFSAWDTDCAAPCNGLGYANYCTQEGGAKAVGCSWNQWWIPDKCPTEYDCPQDDGTCDPNSARNYLLICHTSDYIENIGIAVCVVKSNPPPPPSPPSPPPPSPPPPPVTLVISNPSCREIHTTDWACTVHVVTDTIPPGADIYAMFELNGQNATASSAISEYNQELDINMEYNRLINQHGNCVVMSYFDDVQLWSNAVAIEVIWP